MGYLVTPKACKTISLRGVGVEYAPVAIGGSNAKGAWTELSSALSIGIRSFDVVLLGADSGAWYLLDVGIGPAGSEVVIVPNLQMQTFNDYGNESRIFRLPYAIAKGTRVAMRGQSNLSAKTVRAAILGHAGNRFVAALAVQRSIAYGQNLSTTQGTNIDPGGTANVKGAWTPLVTSTTYPIRRLALAVVPPTAVAFSSWAVDIGVCAAGAAANAEVVLIPDIPFHAADIGKSIGPTAEHFEVALPAAVRLSLRAACDITTSASRVFHAMLSAMG